MHVAFYAPAWPVEAYPNGIVTYVHQMRRALLERGHRVTVFANVLGAHGDAGIVRVAPMGWRRLRHWLKAPAAEDHMLGWGRVIAAAMRKVHRETPIDVVDMEESFGWFADVRRALGVPVAVKLHGPAFLSMVGAELQTPFARRKIEAEGAALRAADVMVSPAAHTLADTLAHYRLAPRVAAHVPNPVDASAPLPRWQLAGCDPRLVLCVGRFDVRKGADLLLHAFRWLLETHPEARLAFVGPDIGIADGEGGLLHFEAYAARLFTPAQRERIDFLGSRSQAEIAALRVQALATVVASRWENQAYASLEAMAQGCPMVCADIPGLAEVVDDGRSGLLYAAESAPALAARLAELLDAPERAAALGAAAHARALAEHAPRVVAERSLAVYRQCIGTEGTP